MNQSERNSIIKDLKNGGVLISTDLSQEELISTDIGCYKL